MMTHVKAEKMGLKYSNHFIYFPWLPNPRKFELQIPCSSFII